MSDVDIHLGVFVNLLKSAVPNDRFEAAAHGVGNGRIRDTRAIATHPGKGQQNRDGRVLDLMFADQCELDGGKMDITD